MANRDGSVHLKELLVGVIVKHPYINHHFILVGRDAALWSLIVWLFCEPVTLLPHKWCFVYILRVHARRGYVCYIFL